jgi:hypothetical protein
MQETGDALHPDRFGLLLHQQHDNYKSILNGQYSSINTKMMAYNNGFDIIRLISIISYKKI